MCVSCVATLRDAGLCRPRTLLREQAAVVTAKCDMFRIGSENTEWVLLVRVDICCGPTLRCVCVVELRFVVCKLLTLQEDLVYKKVGGTSRGGDADYIQAMISN